MELHHNGNVHVLALHTGMGMIIREWEGMEMNVSKISHVLVVLDFSYSAAIFGSCLYYWGVSYETS